MPLLLIVGCDNRDGVANGNESVPVKYHWVEIRGKSDKGNLYYYGQVSDSTIQNVEKTGVMPKAVFLKNYHWFRDVDGTPYPVFHQDGDITGDVAMDIPNLYMISIQKDQDLPKLKIEEEKGIKAENDKKDNKKPTDDIP